MRMQGRRSRGGGEKIKVLAYLSGFPFPIIEIDSDQGEGGGKNTSTLETAGVFLGAGVKNFLANYGCKKEKS